MKENTQESPIYNHFNTAKWANCNFFPLCRARFIRYSTQDIIPEMMDWMIVVYVDEGRISHMTILTRGRRSLFPVSPSLEKQPDQRRTQATFSVTPLPVIPLPSPLPPILWPSPVTVETVAGWRAYKRAEEAAGLTGPTPTRIDTPSFFCAACDIGIGKGFYETEMYLWPLYKQQACLADKTYYFTIDALYVCGGCARRRGLPHRYLLIPASAWDNADIITTAQVTPLAAQVQALFFLRVLGHHYPALLAGLLSRALPRLSSAVAPAGEQQRQEQREEQPSQQSRPVRLPLMSKQTYALPSSGFFVLSVPTAPLASALA